ncbi:MAG: hypothetical protein V3S89_11795 [Desulfobacterales bacterium]
MPNWLYRFRTPFERKNPYFRYVANLLDILVQAALLLLVTAALCIILLYMIKISWNTFIYSPVGGKFVQMEPETARNIVGLFSREIVPFSIYLAIRAFAICLAVSAVCQLLHIARYFYLPRELFGRVILWGFPLAALVAAYIRTEVGFQQFGLIYLVALIPTLCVFSGCFKFAYELVPEAGELLQRVKQIRFK